MPEPRDPTSDIVREPAERFYWAAVVLTEPQRDLRALTRPSARAVQTDLLASALLPPLDELEWSACLAHASDPNAKGTNRLVFCLQDRAKVAEVWGSAAVHYGPMTVPTSIGGGIDPLSFNLLCGRFTPKPVRRTAAARIMVFGVLGLLITGILLIGIERRRTRAEATLANDAEALGSVLSGQRAASLTELLSRRDRLAATRRRLDDPGATGADAAAGLAALLGAWPTGETTPIVQTDSITASRESITLQLAAYTREDATQLAEAITSFSVPSGGTGGSPVSWTLGQPQLTLIKAAAGLPTVRATFRFTRPVPATGVTVAPLPGTVPATLPTQGPAIGDKEPKP